MKSTVNKILLLGAALFCASQTVEATNSPLTFPDGVSAMRVNSDRALSNAPATEPVCAGAFAENNSRFFDLLCTGRCDLFNRVLNLTMTPADKVPSFVKVGSVTGEGNAMKDAVVYAEPTPMGTIEVPTGRNGWVKVELKDQLGAFGSYKDHILLQLRKQGSDQSVNLYNAGESNKHTVEYIEAEEGDVVELVPILSATAIDTDGAHTPVTPNNEVDLNAFGGGESLQEFNFTSVYRVDVDFVQRDMSGVARWVENVVFTAEEGAVTPDKDWQFAIGPMKNTNGKAVVFSSHEGQSSYSYDGIKWLKCTEWNENGLFAYGGGRWCNVNAGISKICTISEDSWQPITTPASFSAVSLSYGNGTFMAINGNGIYTLKDDSNNWQGPIAGSPSSLRAFLCYGNDRWIVVDIPNGENVSCYFSTDNGENWNTLDDNLKTIMGGIDRPSIWSCYTRGYFYGVKRIAGVGSDGCFLIRSSDGNNWAKVKKISSDSIYDVFYYHENRFYLISDDGIITVGLFDPADEGPEAATTNP